MACIKSNSVERKKIHKKNIEEARERRLQSAVDMRKKMLATPLSPEEEAMLKKEKEAYMYV